MADSHHPSRSFHCYSLSMKEAGDGLHAQMNSMMGALQELKLLQVQTALESLDISGRPINRGMPHTDQSRCIRETMSEEPSPNHMPSSRQSLESRNSTKAYPSHPRPRRAQIVDLPGILYSLSREGPSLDSDYSQDSTDDASDWTSSLMSRCRNRQPLVLGDNVFADLVGNWLDLPEVDKEEGEEEERFSFTTNIFKKFLRSVRPDRDKLLKERPGWVAPELPEGDLYKRNHHQHLHQRQPETGLEKMQPLFDYNTAVWV
uniref:Inka box actin regulator 2 n=1 Tax=Pundamilia nyererei TaxID=303518 RepID=A0A3B4G6H0_9CICH